MRPTIRLLKAKLTPSTIHSTAAFEAGSISHHSSHISSILTRHSLTGHSLHALLLRAASSPVTTLSPRVCAVSFRWRSKKEGVSISPDPAVFRFTKWRQQSDNSLISVTSIPLLHLLIHAWKGTGVSSLILIHD